MKFYNIITIYLLFMVFFCGCGKHTNDLLPKQSKKNIHAWGYSGNRGPGYWCDLKPEYSLCGEGKLQSPIDFQKTFKAKLNKIEFNYKYTPLKIINNGHSIQVNCEPGSYIVVDGEEYQLLQFHFHSPSEHTYKGDFYDMEVHFVHKNSHDKLAVVGVFMEKGESNKTVSSIWKNISEDINVLNIVSTESINPMELLPKKKDYYHYFGSLTTPPCSEGVNWSVLKTPVFVSQQQINTFLKIMHHSNNRPVQQLNKRFVLESR